MVRATASWSFSSRTVELRKNGRLPSSSSSRQERIARALVVQALLAEPAGLDVAVVVEDGERVAVLEHPGPLVGQAGGGQDVIGPPSSGPSRSARLGIA